MPNTQIVTRESAIQAATAAKTLLALSKYRLFKEGLIVTPETTKAEMVAVEADYDDYPAGGVELTAFTGPTTPPEGGAVITSPVVNFICTGAQVTPNTIGGFWIETAAGDVHIAGNFDPPIQMAGNLDAITRVVQDVYGRS